MQTPSPSSRIAMLFIAFCAALMPGICQSQPQTKPFWYPDTIGLHIASRHADTGAGTPGDLGWNNANHGLFIGWKLGSTDTAGIKLHHQLIAGGFKNSLYQQSYYAGIDITTEPTHTRWGSFALAISATATSGYDRLTGEYTGGAVPTGQSIKVRCTPATGCRQVLTQPTLLLAIAPGVDYKPAITGAPTLRLSYLHDAGVGSKAIHLSGRWSF